MAGKEGLEEHIASLLEGSQLSWDLSFCASHKSKSRYLRIRQKARVVAQDLWKYLNRSGISPNDIGRHAMDAVKTGSAHTFSVDFFEKTVPLKGFPNLVTGNCWHE